jgi:hypothetical protein
MDRKLLFAPMCEAASVGVVMRETMVEMLSQSGSGVKAQRSARVHRVRPLWSPRATTGFILFLGHKTEVPVVSGAG